MVSPVHQPGEAPLVVNPEQQDTRLRIKQLKLKREGFPLAAEAYAYQASIRSLPSHSRDTLLVYGAGKRKTIDQCLGAPGWGIPSAAVENFFSPHDSSSDSRLGTSAEESASASYRTSSTQPIQAHAIVTSKFSGIAHPTDVTVLPNNTYKQELMARLAADYQGTEFARVPTPGARVQRILRAQNPKSVSHFKVSRVNSSEVLPGGMPILDHAIAALSFKPEWNRTVGILKLFAKMRVPDPDQLPEFRELVIGSSSPDDFKEAESWIDAKHKETVEKYGFCIPALDVECIGIVLNKCEHNWDDITTNMTLDQQITGAVDGPGTEGVSRFHFPVLLMYGGIGWQLHLRIQVVYETKDQVTYITINEAFVDQASLQSLFSRLLPMVGTGVKDDITSFLRAVNCVSSLSLTRDDLPPGVPLNNLLRLCGVSHTQSALVVVVYMVLGGLLPKDWRCSVAAHQWGKPLDELDSGLKAYLAGDIQQVSVSACTLSIVWVSHLIPDGQCIRHGTALDPLEFISRWMETVFKHESHILSSLPSDDSLPTTREQLLSNAGLVANSQNCLLSVCPPWPSVTSGGPKDSDYTREFSYKVIAQHNSLYSTQPPVGVGGVEADEAMDGDIDRVRCLRCPFCPRMFVSEPDIRHHMSTCGTQGAGRGADAPLLTPPPAPEPLLDEFVGKVRRHPAAKRSTEPYFNRRIRDLRTEDLSILSQRMHVPQKQIIAEYIFRDLDRAVELLHLVEEEPGVGVDAFHFFQGRIMVHNLRTYLSSRNRLRRRPLDWEDPWKWGPTSEEEQQRHQLHWDRINRAAGDRVERARSYVARAHSLLSIPDARAPLPPAAAAGNYPPPGCGKSRKARKRRAMARHRNEEQAGTNDEEVRVVRMLPMSPIPGPSRENRYWSYWPERSRSRSPHRYRSRSPVEGRGSGSRQRSHRRNDLVDYLEDFRRRRNDYRAQFSPTRTFSPSPTPSSRSSVVYRPPTPVPRTASADSAIQMQSPHYEVITIDDSEPEDEELPNQMAAVAIAPPPVAPLPALPILGLPQPVPAAAPLQPAAVPVPVQVQVGPAWDGPPAELPLPAPLSAEQRQVVEQARFGHEHGIVARLGEHVLTRDNLRRLCGIRWLKESVISFFLRLIELRSRIDALGLPSVHALDPLFTFSLMRKRYEKPRVHQGKDIFNYDMVLCPINIENNHWALIVLHHSRRTLEYFDSMGGTNMAAIMALNEYVTVEHAVVRDELIEPYKVVVRSDAPQQENEADCGTFVCLYAERLSRRATFDFTQSHMQHYRQKIAYEILTGRLL